MLEGEKYLKKWENKNIYYEIYYMTNILNNIL